MFKYNDPRDLARRMDRWLEHPDERGGCEKQYHAYMAQFDFENCMDRMGKMIIDAKAKKLDK